MYSVVTHKPYLLISISICFKVNLWFQSKSIENYFDDVRMGMTNGRVGHGSLQVVSDGGTVFSHALSLGSKYSVSSFCICKTL